MIFFIKYFILMFFLYQSLFFKQKILSIKLLNNNLLFLALKLINIIIILYCLMFFINFSSIYIYIFFYIFFTNIIYVYLRVYVISIYFFFVQRSKEKNLNIWRLRDFFFNHFNINIVNKYFFLKKYCYIFSNIILFCSIYFISPWIIIIYIIISILLDIDDLDLNFDQIYCGFFQKAPILLTESGEKKMKKYLTFILENYLNFSKFYFFLNLNYGEDFLFVNSKDFKDSFFHDF